MMPCEKVEILRAWKPQSNEPNRVTFVDPRKNLSVGNLVKAVEEYFHFGTVNVKHKWFHNDLFKDE